MTGTETVEWLGEEFHVAERVGHLALMRFAHLADGGADTRSMESLAAMYDLLEQTVHPDDWRRFERHANAQRADTDQLFQMVKDVFAVLAGRPTGRPSASSDGPRITEPNSTDDSSSPDTDHPMVTVLNDKGRPDLALMVRRAQESLAS